MSVCPVYSVHSRVRPALYARETVTKRLCFWACGLSRLWSGLHWKADSSSGRQSPPVASGGGTQSQLSSWGPHSFRPTHPHCSEASLQPPALEFTLGLVHHLYAYRRSHLAEKQTEAQREMGPQRQVHGKMETTAGFSSFHCQGQRRKKDLRNIGSRSPALLSS